MKLYSYTLNELADCIEVGQATLMRFVKKMEFDSFSEFRITLRREFYNQKEETFYFEEEINHLCDETMNENSLNSYGMIADCVWDASHVYFYGVGVSNLVAQTFFLLYV